ncbi:MAG TPA: hypothetical protein VFT71_07665 [Candidatus Nitrosocosmicus sp.]|nr:hypothetical protein [Candidatus Nitrosocosmicus sp.]
MLEPQNQENEEQFDEFGILKIYKSSKRSDAPQPFVMGIDNWHDRIEQWDGEDNDGKEYGEFEGNGLDIVYTSKHDEKQRLNVYADPSKPEVPDSAEDLDRTELMNREDEDGTKRGGWMAQSNDWRDYEVTAIEFIPEQPEGHGGDPDDTTSWYGRGAKHSGSSVNDGSQGCAIKPDLWYSGNEEGWSIMKETIHYEDWKGGNDLTTRGKSKGQDNNILESNNFGNLKGKWFGFKTIVYNEPRVESDNSSYYPVLIETYICECDSEGNPDNNWKLGIKGKDDPNEFGAWSSLPDDQPGPHPHTMSWGGPIITCRTDRESGTGGGYPGMMFKKVSIREIDPGNKFQ